MILLFGDADGADGAWRMSVPARAQGGLGCDAGRYLARSARRFELISWPARTHGFFVVQRRHGRTTLLILKYLGNVRMVHNSLFRRRHPGVDFDGMIAGPSDRCAKKGECGLVARLLHNPTPVPT